MLDEDELEELAEEELLSAVDELIDCSNEELAELLEDDVLSELLDCSADELEVDELSVLLDFSEVLDELIELLGVSKGVEVFAPSLHAVKVSTTAVAVTALKIFLIFIAFFVPFHK